MSGLLSGLERLVLERADLGEVLEEVDSATALGLIYSDLDAQGLLSAEWYRGDLLPLTVALTPAGRLLVRARPG